MDGVVQPKTKGKKGDGDEEETELIHNSSDEEIEDDGDFQSVATTPPMKPVVTDRSVINMTLDLVRPGFGQFKSGLTWALRGFKPVIDGF